MALRESLRRRRPCPLRFSPSASASLATIAEAEVPPAAQRLRNHAGWAGARVIVEQEVPSAAQRLRGDDSSAITGCWERSQVGVRRDSRSRGFADRPAAPRCGGPASECLGLRCRSGWRGRMAHRGFLRRRRPCPLRFSLSASALLVTIAEADVPPAAQRLRNHGGWAGARVIAEQEVPPAAQRLHDNGGWAGAGVIAEQEVPPASPSRGCHRRAATGRPPGGPTAPQ
jgi:uncharacterized protein YciI